MNEKVVINWSEPVELFMPGIYNTDEKFIEHLRKFILENENPIFDEKGIYMFLSGTLKPQEKLSIVIIEAAIDSTIRDKITKKKGHVREFKCLYKNYKNENLYIKIGKLEESNVKNSVEKVLCSLIDYVSPSCIEPCKQNSGKQIIIYNKGSFSPLNQIYGLQEE